MQLCLMQAECCVFGRLDQLATAARQSAHWNFDFWVKWWIYVFSIVTYRGNPGLCITMFTPCVTFSGVPTRKYWLRSQGSENFDLLLQKSASVAHRWLVEAQIGADRVREVFVSGSTRLRTVKLSRKCKWLDQTYYYFSFTRICDKKQRRLLDFFSNLY